MVSMKCQSKVTLRRNVLLPEIYVVHQAYWFAIQYANSFK